VPLSERSASTLPRPARRGALLDRPGRPSRGRRPGRAESAVASSACAGAGPSGAL